MARKPREESKYNLYHVYLRGVGKQTIFLDDEDRKRFLKTLEKVLDTTEGALLAWCLMGNHLHMLLDMNKSTMSMFMKRIEDSYVWYFNVRYEHVGHVFQGRYGSEPINSESQLMAVVRYIHQNPVRAGLSATCDYEWSSYREYLGRQILVSADLILSLFGDRKGFKRFHDDLGDYVPARNHLRRLTDEEARLKIQAQMGTEKIDALVALPDEQRNRVIKDVCSAGVSARQLERLTGISRKIVALVKGGRDQNT